jgi:hypothetical protein
LFLHAFLITMLDIIFFNYTNVSPLQ